ncbi:signal transduction histidine kinase [Agromyces cerinus]|uniref:sensor histidine kinase n=1 Tax=Agromyces cerinus TaxID=33878 RepID=UPI00195DCBC5|nr:histidine kinase [Agromyces cerinus]MBM7830584.1 signal transduction histidine kinase [Agromyces cerinus]
MDLKLFRPSWLVLLAPAAGAAYIVLWWIAEAGRLGNAPLGPIVAVVPFIAFGLAIAISQRWPAVALGLIGAVLVVQLLVESARFGNTSWPAYLPLLYALFNISAFGSYVVHWISLPASGLYAVIVTLLLTLRSFGAAEWPVLYSPQAARDYQNGGEFEVVGMFAAACVIAVGLAVGAWCAGLALRMVTKVYTARRHAQALERDLAAVEDELVALSEREQLAQEVHDVMAHSLAVIAAQADGTRMTDDSLAAGTRNALSTIADTARDGLTELRQLLDSSPLLGEAERPKLTDLQALLDRVRGAGLDCVYAEHGESKPLSPIQQLSVFRIVQEALTNAVRHADTDGSTTVTLDWRGPGLALLIATPASATGATRPGRGIRGMQERAQIAGGWLTAAVDEGDAFIVNAFIPVDEPTRLAIEAIA